MTTSHIYISNICAFVFNFLINVLQCVCANFNRFAHPGSPQSSVCEKAYQLVLATMTHSSKHEDLSEASFRVLTSIVPHASGLLTENLFGDVLTHAVFVLKTHLVNEAIVETVCEFMEALASLSTCVCLCVCICSMFQCIMFQCHICVHASMYCCYTQYMCVHKIVV